MKPLGDLKWTLPPLTAFFFAFGGWHLKIIRRAGLPVSICLYAWLYSPKTLKNSLILAFQFFVLWGVLTLPLTLIGDKMTMYNMIWAFVLGALSIFSLFPICFLHPKWGAKVENLIYWVAIGAMIYGLSIVASATVSWFEHKWTETILGFLIGGAAADTIGEKKPK